MLLNIEETYTCKHCNRCKFTIHIIGKTSNLTNVWCPFCSEKVTEVGIDDHNKSESKVILRFK